MAFVPVFIAFYAQAVLIWCLSQTICGQMHALRGAYHVQLVFVTVLSITKRSRSKNATKNKNFIVSN